MLLIVTLLADLVLASLGPEIISTLNQHWSHRWANYPKHCKGRVNSFYEDDTGHGQEHQIVELKGFPEPQATYCFHFQGSPLEAEDDPELIHQRLQQLVQRYGPSNIHFSTLEGWTSDALTKELLKFGFVRESKRPIMALNGSSSLLISEQLSFGPEFKVERVLNMERFQQYICHRPAPIRFMMDVMDEEALQDSENQYWCIVHTGTDACIATALVSVHGHIGNLGQVSTLQEWKGRDLDTWLVSHVIREAYKSFADLEVLYVYATPETQSINEKIGFSTVGWINTFKHGN